MLEIKDYFQRRFFNNLNFFLSILFKENQEIMKIVEGVANLSVKYQMYFDDYRSRNKEVEHYLKQPNLERNKLIQDISSQFEAMITEFNDKIISKVDDSIFEEKKAGFFGKLFSSNNNS